MNRKILILFSINFYFLEKNMIINENNEDYNEDISDFYLLFNIITIIIILVYLFFFIVNITFKKNEKILEGRSKKFLKILYNKRLITKEQLNSFTEKQNNNLIKDLLKKKSEEDILDLFVNNHINLITNN